MMIHLESGTCASGVCMTDIDHWAQQCYQHWAYTTSDNGGYQYKCPDCGMDFKYVSGLFQHVESPACDMRYEGSIAKLRDYIEMRTCDIFE